MIDSEKATISSQFADEDDAESRKFLTNGFLGKTKYEEYQEEYHPGTTSFGISAFNLSNAIMGSGILGLSYAMANTGIILFVFLLFGVAILSLYSVHLLLEASKEGGSMVYEKLGERAFGLTGKIAAFSSITLQNIGAISSYLFIIKYELPEVIRAFLGIEELSGEWYLNGKYLVVIVSLSIILPLTFLKNLGYLGYTSGFSLTCMIFFLSVVIYKKSQIPCPLPLLGHHALNQTTLGNSTGHLLTTPKDDAHIDDDMCKPKYFVFNSQVVVLLMYCKEKLKMALLLFSRSQKKMQHVSNVSITAMLIMYLMAALFGYLTFYDQVETELLHTYTQVYKFDTLLLLVRLAVLVAVTLTVPIVLFPIRTSIQELFFPGRSFNWLRHIGIAGFLLILNDLLVIFVPSIRDIFGFIGASAATMLIFILPSACYIKLVKKESMKSMQKIGVS
uniref:Solute carrier family 38 member 4 n=1 Tax=Callorhinchus milii TaxID=7868 RepID=A0A4W3JAC8_CALMI